MSDDLAYVAGFIDADGCISLYANKGAYRPSIEVAQVHIGILKQLQAILNCGGRIYKRHRRGNCRDAYVLAYFPGECRNLLEVIRPYLRVKHPQADLLLRYYSVVDSHEHRDYIKKVKLQKIKDKFTILNKRGR